MAAYHVAKIVLEIKCPKTMPSQPVIYYFAQLHMEMHVCNTRTCYFVCYVEKDGKENLRVWQVNFNDCFWHRLLACIDCVQAVRSSGKKGTPFCAFDPMFTDFKRTYMRKAGAWKNFVTPLFERRKMSYSVLSNTYGAYDMLKKSG